MTQELHEMYDVVVVGGGAAGLNGALQLARSRRSVAVIDAGAPRNAPAEGVHGLLGREGMPPGELLERGRAEVRGYGGRVVSGEVAGVRRVRQASGERFEVELADGRRTLARRLLVTIGLVDELPDVAGLRERWGRDVIHCPYCHGWEARDRAIGVIGSGPMAAHQALLFSQLSADVTLFAHTMPALTDEQWDRVAARGIDVVEGRVARIEIDAAADRITGVRLVGGKVFAREVIVVAPRAALRAEFLRGLGLQPQQHESGMGEYLPADPAGRSEVPGVWFAGNVADPSAQVGAAAAAGATAGAQINFDLVMEETNAAVAARNDPFSAASEARVNELAAVAAPERHHGLG
ncbi:NAD(P)/FAD-dependent oxidoreductase [Actinospica acidithermotolerans]|uniref:NAD(P)/FAD-dependent oxidoreductase n=1 Tax=Actinospica acidithermotolerans TaxID=2828514 RepID=UPI001BAE2918